MPYAKRALGFAYYEIGLHGADSRAPRVIYFHGRGGRAEGVGHPIDVGIPAWVLVPQAKLHLPGSDGFAWSAFSVTSNRPLELAATLLQTANEVARFLDQVRRNEGEQFVLSGFSQGSMLALALAFFHPDLCHSVVVGAGHVSRALEPQRMLETHKKIPIRVVQGSRDQIVPSAAMIETSERLRALGYDIETHVFDHDEHSLNGAMMDAFAGFMQTALSTQMNAQSQV